MGIPTTDITYGEWSKRLQQEIAESTELTQEAHLQRDWFWVIDACAHPELPGFLWQLESSPDAWPLYMNTLMEDATHSGPWFVPCKAYSNITHWMLSQLEQKFLGFLLSVAPGSGNTLFEHLQNILECTALTGSDGSQEKPGLYRYYDPRILYGLSTFHDTAHMGLVKGPAQSLHAWECGRRLPVEGRYASSEYTFCSDSPALPKDLIDHLWAANQVHTVIGTLGKDVGKQLRSKPLPVAYDYVAEIQALLQNSPYTSHDDIGFATAYALLSETDDWKLFIENIVLKEYPHCQSLSEAFEAASSGAYTAISI